MQIEPVAYFHSPFGEKFGIPRQSGLVEELRGEIRFEPGFSSPDAVRGLEGFDYAWLIWGFSKNRPGSAEGSLTVRPPRLGGNERIGVFASRSPYRPNPLGLSCVRIGKIGNGVVEVFGADLADGTPIYDVKPYVTYADCHPEARSGFVDDSEWKKLEVVMDEETRASFSEEDAAALEKILSLDPRPKYQDDPDRIYGMDFAGKNVRFRVVDGKIIIL